MTKWHESDNHPSSPCFAVYSCSGCGQFCRFRIGLYSHEWKCQEKSYTAKISKINEKANNGDTNKTNLNIKILYCVIFITIHLFFLNPSFSLETKINNIFSSMTWMSCLPYARCDPPFAYVLGAVPTSAPCLTSFPKRFGSIIYKEQSKYFKNKY